MALDTLSYARRLKQAGVPDLQAEAMADATRELISTDVATQADIAALKSDIAALRSELKAEIAAVRAEIAAVRAEITASEQRMMTAMGALELRITIRLGGLIAVGIAILAAIIKL